MEKLGVLIYGSGKKTPSVQELSVTVDIPTRKTVVWLEGFLKKHKDHEHIKNATEFLTSVIRDNAAINLPDQIYEINTTGITTSRAALHMCRGVTRKALWLISNFKMSDIIIKNANVVKSEQHDALRSIYMSSYSSILNYWFGWNHNGIKGIKSREYTSFRDPIAIIRYVAYMRKLDELSNGNIDEAAMTALGTGLSFIVYLNTQLKAMFFEANDGKSFLLAKSTQNNYLFKDNFALLSKKKGADTITNIGKIVEGILSTFAYPLLDIAFQEFEIRVKIQGSWSLDLDNKSSLISLISKWISQQMLWSWGGVYGDMEEEVMSNSVPGMEKINKNNLFFYMFKENFTQNKENVEKTQRSLWLDLAWVSQREELAVWLKEMWPEAFDGTLKQNMDISDAWKSNTDVSRAYSISLRAHCHPVFAAHVINTISDTAGKTILPEIEGVLNGMWSKMSVDILGLGEVRIIDYKPHLLWIRNISFKDPKKRAEKYALFTSQINAPCSLNSAGGRKDSWGCICNLFSYDDDLKLEKNKINLQQEIAAAQAKISMLLAEKARIMEAQKTGVFLIEVDKKQVPCAEAYSALMINMNKAKNALAQCLASSKKSEEESAELRGKLSTCEASLKETQKPNVNKAECETDMALLKIELGITGDAKVIKTVKKLQGMRDALVALSAPKNNSIKEILENMTAIKANSDKLHAMEEAEKSRLIAVNTDAPLRTSLDHLATTMRSLSKKDDLADVVADASAKYQELVELKESNRLAAEAKAAADIAVQRNITTCIQRVEKAEKDLADLQSSSAQEKTDAETAWELERTAVAKAAKDSKAACDAIQKQLDDLLILPKPQTADEAKAKAQRAERLMTEFSVRLKLDICNKALDKLKSDYAALEKKRTDDLAKLKKDLDDAHDLVIGTMVTRSACDSEKTALTTAHNTAVDTIKKEHDKAILKLEGEHALAMKNLTSASTTTATSFATEKTDLMRAHSEEIAEMTKQENIKLTALGTAHSTAISAKQTQIDTLDEKVKKLETEIATLKQAKVDLVECAKKLQMSIQEVASLTSNLNTATSQNTTLSAQVITLTAERDALNTSCAGKAAVVSQLSAVSAQLATKSSEFTACSAELALKAARVGVLETEIQTLQGNLAIITQELSLWRSGSPMPVVPQIASGTPSTQIVSTAMPSAYANMVQVGSAPERVSTETVDMMALGVACGSEKDGGKPAGCFETANVPCDTPEQVINGQCNYGTIPVPMDINSVSLTYSVLDPGSKVKLQLQSALFKYNRAISLIMGGSPVVLDRHLYPLKKLYDYSSIDSSSIMGTLKVPNMQYSRYLDTQAGTVARTFFEFMHGRTGGLRTADEATAIGVELIKAPNTMYKVGTGSFSGMFRTSNNEIVHPARVHIHPAYIGNIITPDVYILAGDVYVKYGAVANPAALMAGMDLLKQAARHLINATMVYIGIAFDSNLVKIPSTSIPAGAFSMLPRADVDALLALAILYPRTVERQYVPDLSMDLGTFEKDDVGSAVSRARAATCEVLGNYSLESALTGDITLAAKTDPANRDIVMTEAAKRVAEIAMLAETMNK